MRDSLLLRLDTGNPLFPLLVGHPSDRRTIEISGGRHYVQIDVDSARPPLRRHHFTEEQLERLYAILRAIGAKTGWTSGISGPRAKISAGRARECLAEMLEVVAEAMRESGGVSEDEIEWFWRRCRAEFDAFATSLLLEEAGASDVDEEIALFWVTEAAEFGRALAEAEIADLEGLYAGSAGGR